MNIESLRINNYELFLSGVSEGAIPVSSIGGNLEVGVGQPNPTVTGIVGGPHLPEINALPKNLAGMSYGASGYYPKPFLSVQQRFNNGVYTHVGAYAKLIKYKKPYTTTCIDDECGDDQFVSQEIWGRVGNILTGTYSSQLGFYAQDWYNVDDGAYDAAFWTNHSSIDPPIPDKQQWWDQCTKSTIRIRFANDDLQEFAIVEVAINNLQPASNQYFKADDLNVFQDGSLQLLPIITSLITGLGVWI